MVDPNVYALNISLQLDAATAFDTLDRFEESIIGVEQNIADAAQRSIGQIDDMVTKIESNLGNLNRTIQSMGLESDQLAAAMAGAGVNVSDMGDDVESQIANLIKARDYWEEIRDFNEEVVDFAEEEIGNVDKFIDVLSRVHDTIKAKNLGHEEELSLIDAETDLLDSLVNSSENFGAQTRNNVVENINLFNVMRQIFDLLLEFDQETDNFTQANYRLYGSQQQIVNATRQISAETGILRAEAISAYKALADVKYPREQIGKLATEIGKLNVSTGLSVDSIANFAHSMRQTGIDADQTIMQLSRMSAAQRALGLSTHDLDRILNDATMSVAEQITMFGEEAPEAFQKAALGLAAVGKETGMAAEQQQEWMKTMQATGTDAYKFWQTLGNLSEDEMNDVNARYDAMGTAVENFAAQAGMSMNELAEGAQTPEMQMQLDILARTFGVTANQMVAMARAQGELTAEQKEALLTMDGLNATFEAEIERNRIWQETLATLSRQWETLKARVMGVIGPFMQLAADALIPVIKALNWMLGLIQTMIDWGGSLISWLEDTIPGFKMVSQVVKFAAGWLIILGTAILAIGGMAGLLGGLFSTMAAGVKAVGSAIGGFLENLGKSVQKVMLPLLALGAAFLMVGAGAYLFAQSVAVVAEQGWAAVPAMFGMVAAIAVLGAVLVGLAMLAQGPVALGLLAIGATLLMVGGAVWLVGAGVKMMAEAFQILAGALLEVMATGSLVDFASQLLSASWRIMLAAPMLLAAAVILAPAAIALAVAGGLLAIATTIFAFGINMLGDAGEKFQSGMQGLLSGVSLMAQMDFGVLISGALSLMTAGLILGAAALIFTPAALAIGVAGMILGVGLGLLASGASKASEVDFSALASNLLYGASILVWVGPLLMVGAAALLPAGITMGVAGLAMWVGALGISKSADLLAGVGDKLRDAGASISGAVPQLTTAMFGLVPVALAALFVGPSLLVGATSMLPGALMLRTAGYLIEAGAIDIAAGTQILSSSIDALIQTVGQLHVAGQYMLYAGTYLLGGATMLSAGAFVLAGASVLLVAAGAAMLPASIAIYTGMFWMEGALKKLGNIAPSISAASQAMWLLASSFVILAGADYSVLEKVAEAGLQAVPKVDAFAEQLDEAATRLDAAVDKFQEPSQRLIGTLNAMQTAVEGIDLQGLALESDVAQMGQELEKYATALEAAAMRVETAVASKALPAIDEANAAGVSDVARSEAITTVQVMDQREGGETNEAQATATQQVQLLTQLVELLSTVAGDKSGITSIQELLEEYLPDMVNKESGLLASDMNQWMK